MTENPDAEKAALAEALEGLLIAVEQLGVFPDGILARNARILLANLSPAAKEILEKAQAHDAMGAEVDRLYRDIRAALAGKEPE